MSDAVVTTVANAPNNQTPAGAMTQADGSAPRSGVIPDNAYERLAEADREKYSRVRAGPDGGSEWRLREVVERESAGATSGTKQPDGGTAGDPTAAKPGDQSTAKPGAAATVTEDGRLKVGDLLLDAKDIQTIMTESAAREARKATVPATAADYKLDLPSDFVMPEGQSWQWQTDHPVLGPIIGQAKELAHSLGMDQAGFSKMMSLYAASQVHEAQLISKAAAAEAAKLGANVTARVTAVTQFIRGAVGDDKIAGAITRQLLTADQIVGWERIISKAATQGHASFTQHGRTPDTAGQGPLSRLSDADYEAMPASERFRVSRLS
jgi:hypothetical protein